MIFLLQQTLPPRGRAPQFSMGSPRSTKKGFHFISLSPIVSSIGAVSYETSKELTRILKPLVGKSPHHVHNTQDFIEQIKDIKFKEDQCMMSYDVKALFTSVPIQPALNMIQKLLEEDKRTPTDDNHVCGKCLHLAGVLFKEHIFYLPMQVL